MKIETVYGVKMSGLEDMIFSKYLSNNNIAMNTVSSDERTRIAQEWLNRYHLEEPLEIVSKHVL